MLLLRDYGYKQKAHSGSLPISSALKKDLVSLCAIDGIDDSDSDDSDVDE